MENDASNVSATTTTSKGLEHKKLRVNVIVGKSKVGKKWGGKHKCLQSN